MTSVFKLSIVGLRQAQLLRLSSSQGTSWLSQCWRERAFLKFVVVTLVLESSL